MHYSFEFEVIQYFILICTSSNAVQIVDSFPKDQPIIFAPDKNLGKYVASITGRDLVLWEGSCVVHEAFSMEKLLALHKQNPNARIIAHPEAEDHILQTACFVGSTAGMLNFVKKNPHEERKGCCGEEQNDHYCYFVVFFRFRFSHVEIP